MSAVMVASAFPASVVVLVLDVVLTALGFLLPRFFLLRAMPS